MIWGMADLASSTFISAASVNDLEEIYQIERECFPADTFAKWHYKLLLVSSDVVFLKSCLDTEIAGFIVGAIQPFEATAKCSIHTINVRTRYRRRGIATALVSELERRLIERGCSKIILQARTDNLASISLFSKLGYRKTRILRNYYAHGEDGVELEKMLEPKHAL